MKILNAPIHMGERAKEHEDKVNDQNKIFLKQAEEDILVSNCENL